MFYRILYDEDSPKNHQLRVMIDQLEASEPGSPQLKSPSRELATTLRNLKRLESMLKGIFTINDFILLSFVSTRTRVSNSLLGVGPLGTGRSQKPPAYLGVIL